jgi:uncharacterized membrane protein YfcA
VLLGSSLVAVAIVGFIAQLVDGALGMGYGVTSTTLLLTVGLAPAVASASVHFAELGTTLASGTAHWRFGNVDWKTVSRLAVPGGIGGFLGAYVLSNVDAAAARPWVSLMLSVLGVLILIRAIKGTPVRMKAFNPRLRTLGPLGIFAGFLDAAGGGGWGPVTTSTLMASGRLHPRMVIGTVSASEFLVALGASIGFLLGLGAQAIAWDAVAVLLAGGVIAAPIAAWLVKHIDHRSLGAVVAGMILITNSERVLGLVGVGAEAAQAVRILLFTGTVCLTAGLLLSQRRAKKAAMADGPVRSGSLEAEAA